METYGVNFREIKDAQDFLAALSVIKSEFELLNEKTTQNIDTNNQVISEIDKAKSMAMSIEKSHEKHIEIIKKTNKIMKDIDELPEQFKKQLKETLSSINMDQIKGKIEFLLKEELFKLENSTNKFKSINKEFAENFYNHRKTIELLGTSATSELIEFKKLSKNMANRSILYFMLGFVFCFSSMLIFYFLFLKN